MVMRCRGSTTSIREIKSLMSSDMWPGSVKMPPLIFLKRFGIFSSSEGKEPHNRA